jgi:hypothetical protein
MNPSCYAQRLLNPFRGVMNIIEYRGAEAVTTDGLKWDIYVRDTHLVADLADGHKVQTSDIRYGSWSKEHGLKRGAIYPSDDFKKLEHLGAIVYEYLLQHHQDIPFPFRDKHELWLLDALGLPLALLDSVIREEDIELDSRIDWRAGRECGKHFHSAAAEVLTRHQADERSTGEYLTEFINTQAGNSPRAQWFLRTANGSSTGLCGVNLPGEWVGRRLPAGDFPCFHIRDQGLDGQHRQLVEDFIAWQAPCLLLLHDLDRQSRARLEQQATKRALAVAKHYRLYPTVIDSDTLKATLVEALLRANEPSSEDDAEAMATYYIELNVTRTN